MNYSRVFIDAIGYELAPIVVTSAELEQRIEPLYQALRMPQGQLESLTGVSERRWWEPNFPVSEGAIRAARKALAASNVQPADVDVMIYAGVCREHFEPATACRVAAGVGVNPGAFVYDISNACLGVLNGIVDIANRIELGQARAGLVVSCETAREIVENTIDRMVREPTMDVFKSGVATLTGGSGAVAVLVTDGSFGQKRRRLAGGATQTAPQHHNLCRWGLQDVLSNSWSNLVPGPLRQATSAVVGHFLASKPAAVLQSGIDLGLRHLVMPFMATDAASVLKYGVELGTRTWKAFSQSVGWARDQMDKVICHQVGAAHRETILKTLDIPPEKDFPTYPFLGNIGTVSLPLTAAIAEEREFLQSGDRVGFLGIGSGLNCLMLGLHW
jgi:3-oxoacyl-[acyl-carrier-protein] synthase-3